MLQEAEFNPSFVPCQGKPVKDISNAKPVKQICPISDNRDRWEGDKTGQAPDSSPDLSIALKVTGVGGGGWRAGTRESHG